MASSSVRVVLLFILAAALWNTGETCEPGSFSAAPGLCDQYYLCVTSGAATTNVLQRCPEKQNFDPNRLYCTANYECLICD